MRPIALIFLIFAAGIFLGHEYWPQSHSDPTWHFRFHRGKMPAAQPAPDATNKPPAVHGRILNPPQAVPEPKPN
ncbi:MAG: hypothetical protein WCS65_00135 [Verrucomicrobiae bacterium]